MNTETAAPEVTTAHTDAHALHHAPHTWVVRQPRENDATAHPFRQCSYCGSIHPLDLLSFLGEGVTMELADMKYGYPHKFYISGIPNPLADGTTNTYAMCGTKPVDADGWEEYDTGFFSRDTGLREKAWRKLCGVSQNPEYIRAKFYSEHLNDLSREEFIELSMRILSQTGVIFNRDDKQKLLFTIQRVA